ncbi:MAG: ATP-binding cassette domain-containing protein [Ignavibacteria bacterium]|nr:ATP-binding cassette domain-containing protein [Ignavibacteria bacterium]
MSFISLHNVAYRLPDGTMLFSEIDFSCTREHIGLVGKNGVGKTSLINCITGKLPIAAGAIQRTGKIACLPQCTDDYHGFTVAEVLQVNAIRAALERVTAGTGSNDDFVLMENNWDIENRLLQALHATGIGYISPDRQFSSLSGGEQVRCLFSRLLLENADLLILDEPTNHLDYTMREFVYNFIGQFPGGVIVVSHDVRILNSVDCIGELQPAGLTMYGGNYEFYREQKDREEAKKERDLITAGSALKAGERQFRITMERQKKRVLSAGQATRDGGIPRIMLNKLRNKGENTAANLAMNHEKKLQQLRADYQNARQALDGSKSISLDFRQAIGHEAKILVSCIGCNYLLPEGRKLWKTELECVLRGTDRIHITGRNGSGKTTLCRMMINELHPSTGSVELFTQRVGKLDQDASILHPDLTVLENMQLYNDSGYSETELRIRLARFLFYNDDVYKKASGLSGGEKMKAAIACMFSRQFQPELLVLDEPTNNLDLDSVAQLAAMLQTYRGALLIISHDSAFIDELGITGVLSLDDYSG